LDKMIAASKYLRERYSFRLRLNTNGLGDLIHKRSIAKEVCEAVDCVSVSLNMPDAKSYNEVVRPAYGEKSFDAMLKFAVDCKKYVPHVVLTVVEKVENQAEIDLCQKLCDERGLKLRVRVYEDS
ncbi:MAG: radical SAM protein, partial [Veillonellaceae bacterium]|nr:radical SAM protein [Veillonellaceae bacterium]